MQSRMVGAISNLRLAYEEYKYSASAPEIGGKKPTLQSNMASLLEPVTVGGKLPLRNRVTMGSMTRNRCVDDYKPGQAQITHYADRARDGTGLIVNEGTFVDWTGCDWKYSPFMITDDHSAAWKAVTDAVHKEGGKIFFQAWHAGNE